MYSYVKPGAPHRYSTMYRDLHEFVSALTSALDTYVKACITGFEIGRGRSSFESAGLGGLVSEAYRLSKKAAAEMPLPSLHLLLIPTVIAASYSIEVDGKLSLSKFRRALQGLLMYNPIKETESLYNALRGVGGGISRAIALTEVTPGRISTEGLSIYDFLDHISREYLPASYLITRVNRLTELTEAFIKSHIEGASLNDATVLLYRELLHDFTGYSADLRIKGKEDFLRLLKLDRELYRKWKEELRECVAVLSAPVFLGLLSLSVPRMP